MNLRNTQNFLIICLFLWFATLPGGADENHPGNTNVPGNSQNDTPSDSQKDGETDYYLLKKREVVVVTAAMTKKALKDCPTTVAVLSKADIETSSANNALDILRSVPGIFVNRSGDFGRADVDIRGLGQNCRRIAVLVDGKPEKMGLFGCAVSHAFPLANVANIEVVKGPASMLYGGEALGGAVNIITRMPEEKFETSLSALYGSFNTQELNLEHGANLAPFKYFFTYDKRYSDGHVENAGYSGSSFTGKLVYEVSPSTQLSFQGKYFAGLKDEPGTIEQPLSGYWNDYKRGSFDLTCSGSMQQQQHEWSFKLYRNFGHHQFSDGWDSRDYTNGAIMRFTTRAVASSEITIGGDLRFFGGESLANPAGQWDKNEGSIFIQDELTLAGKWIFSGGMRLQFDSLYGQEWCPRLGIVFRAGPGTTLRSVVSKGFRSPQLNELYIYPPANPQLQPERVWNVELGFEQKLGRRLMLEGSIFHMKGTNMIRTIPNSAPPPLYIFANIDEFSFYGAEVQLDAALGSHLSANMAYAYMNYGDYNKGKPGQKLDFTLRYNKKDFTAQVQGQYVTDYFADDPGTIPIPSYFLLNSRVIIPLFKSFDIILDMNNILNEDYSIYGEFPGMTAGLYRMPRRNFQVGFRFSK